MTQADADPQYTILVVDDEPISRKLIESTLRKADYGVVTVANGRAALDAMQDRFFPMVLTDWVMPEMDGVELCRAIRDQAESSYVFIILLTSNDSQDDIIAGLEAGADEYLTKPFNRTELLARLKTGARIIELERSLRRANEELARIVITDPLTGCFNRGYLSERLPAELKRAKRYREPLSIILCDVDHFKRINDKHGHQMGDEVLKRFGQFLRDGGREGIDWVARYGGEEFVLVLPNTAWRNALIAAERLRAELSGEAICVAAATVSVTASFGIVGFDPETPDASKDMDLMIKAADRWLYDAKESGRNRCKGGGL